MYHLNVPDYGALIPARLGVGAAAAYGILGYVVVFIGLVLLMAVVIIVGKIMVASAKKKAAAPAAPVPAAPVPPAPEAPKELAPGSAGGVKLYDVSERDAAMIMAIVANKMGKPLNEIRFKSIREVK